MEKKKETIEITLVENERYGESYAGLRVREGTDISDLVKEMKLFGIARGEYDFERDKYLPCTGQLKEGPLYNRETYIVYRIPDSWNPIHSLCYKFEEKHAQKMKGGELK